MGSRQLVIEVDENDYQWLLKKKKKVKLWIDKRGNKRGANLSLATDAIYAENDYSITITNIIDLTPGV